MSEPTTEAGRALLDDWASDSERVQLEPMVLAIEQEARRQALAEVRALREAALAVVDAQPMDWSVPSLHPDHIEVHENAFDALMDAIDALDRASAILDAEVEKL